MRRSLVIWFASVVALFFSLFSSLEIERVREVFADGSVLEFCRVDLDGVIPRQDVGTPDPSPQNGGRRAGCSRRLAQVLESPGFSVPASTVTPAHHVAPAFYAALPPPRVTFCLPLSAAGLCAIETRGPPLRPQLTASPSLRAPPVA